jgi:hypothetical protein
MEETMSTRGLSQVRMHRRGAVAALAAGTSLLVGGIGGGFRLADRTAEAAALQSFVSGALGLTRDEIEDRWGAGEGPFAGQGHYFDVQDLYTHEADGETFHVAYQKVNGEEIAVYVQVDWAGDGATETEARDSAVGLIPDDARITDLYSAPPTPGGPLAFSVYRYRSEALGAVHDGALAPEILVIFHERWGDASVPNSTRVAALSITVRERTQLTP